MLPAFVRAVYRLSTACAVVAALMYLTRKVDWYAYAAARPLTAG